jgi:Uma2 family endonuclease
LAREVESEERHEYRDGEIFRVTGATPNHNRIAGNLFALLKFALKRQPYDIFISDQRLWIPERRIYAYPDVMVVREPLELQAGRNDTVTNPLLVAEVLSKSMRNYDKGEKFDAYRTIPSLSEYLLVDQYAPQVMHYAKTDTRTWTMREYEGLEATLALGSLEVSLALADLYDKVQFTGS